jgi:PPOX class probable F420-dependent enzyme
LAEQGVYVVGGQIHDHGLYGSMQVYPQLKYNGEVTMQIPADLVTRIVNRWPIARLGTVAEDGSPHLVPIVYVFRDGRFWSPIDGKPKQGNDLQRLRNAIANPKATLLIDHYEDDWWIRVEVNLSVVRLDKVDAATLQLAQSATIALKSKYPQYANVPVLRDPHTLLSMRPQSFTSWSAEALTDIRVDDHGRVTILHSNGRPYHEPIR